MFSLHLDTLGVATAHLSGFRETWFPPPAVCFHIEHALGSGYTPENEVPMFERIERQGIGWFDFNVIESLFDEMRERRILHFNTDAWGLRDIPLDETICTRERIEVRKVPEALQADPYAPVTAIRPEFNADRYFRLAFKRLVERAEAAETWAKAAVARAEAAEEGGKGAATWAKAAEERAEAAEEGAKGAATWAKVAETWAKAAEERMKGAETRAEMAEVQLGKYRRFFGWLEKVYNKVKFDWLPAFK